MTLAALAASTLGISYRICNVLDERWIVVNQAASPAKLAPILENQQVISQQTGNSLPASAHIGT